MMAGLARTARMASRFAVTGKDIVWARTSIKIPVTNRVAEATTAERISLQVNTAVIQ
jgi:hypothetical protein